eukprot:NODE_986_length_1724_cov_41.932373_g925_i0.p1 GENE.NODE_986_length_1724_cov_41.932373_g925_i0~~NODE_986_length_1724_cov_41.932373_g925_i0.p1  ORF type:complete len:456 (-),score=96.45 NODE_986_length_1724_cov_41.932373_g925_i0:55-1422(-)
MPNSYGFDSFGTPYAGLVSDTTMFSTADSPVTKGQQSRFVLVMVTIYQKHEVTFITFDSTKQLPYAIDNRTTAKVEVAQTKALFRTPVGPTQTVGFAWDDPSGDCTLCVWFGVTDQHQGCRFEVQLDNLTSHTCSRVELPPQFILPLYYVIRLRRDGVIVLTLVNDASLTNTRRFQTNATELSFSFHHLGLSLATRPWIELCYTTLVDVVLKLTLSSIKHHLSLTIGGLQMDDQSDSPQYPVVLDCPTVSKERAHALEFLVERSLLQAPACIHLTRCLLRVSEVELRMGRPFLSNLLRYLMDLQGLLHPSVHQDPHETCWHHHSEALVAVHQPGQLMTQKVVVEELRICPITVIITLGRSEGTHDPLFDLIPPLIRIAVLSHVHHSRFHWDEFLLRSTGSAAAWIILQRLQRHYLRQIITQAYKLLPRPFSFQTRSTAKRVRPPKHRQLSHAVEY